MWAIAVVTIQLLMGPQVFVVTDAGTFKSKADCETEIAASVPAKLEEPVRRDYEQGYRVYACVRVMGAD